jgi:hypothetical protein
MNVRDLRIALESLPEDLANAEVITEGCDCWGDVAFLLRKKIGKATKILLCRSDGDEEEENAV